MQIFSNGVTCRPSINLCHFSQKSELGSDFRFEKVSIPNISLKIISVELVLTSSNEIFDRK